ncbi:HAD family hydrolase [Denitrificimonas sp. JX-1]|uniref:HAD family hydrolase n=1 Tax=Denitrificimonas halotolerans TaxID=3098930 RepID=A0ABU5GSN7_9GAMM|nr:HAD family hydrolase [Denitrificimonas sp. JX-1]MDY7219997.1 HAD family hydrolase [Denitrificimonas sp. JX-1]
MRLAIFDLDNTLLAGDSDHLWGEYLCAQGLVDVEAYRAKNDQFYQDYLSGQLDVIAYQNFCQEVLGRTDKEMLSQWHADFMRDYIEPIILPKGEKLLAKHRAAGDLVMIITATNRFITGPIAQRLGVEHLIATECGMQDGQYTGELVNVPSFQEGKITRLNAWLAEHQATLVDSYFYSDSHNDLPLLEQVTHPVAVDPDDTLRELAEQRGWKVLSLRD